MGCFLGAVCESGVGMASSGLTSRAWQSVCRAPEALWRVLAGSLVLPGLGALLVLCLLAAAAWPALRPGVRHALAPGETCLAWKALHPALTWGLRALLGALVLASLVRLADDLLPAWRPLGEALLVAEVAADATAGAALWDRVRAGVRRLGYELRANPEPGAPEGRCALVALPLIRRLAAAGLYLGVLLLLDAAGILWRQGWVSASAPLLLGDAVQVGPPVSLAAQLDELQLLPEPQAGLGLAAATVLLGDSGGEMEPVVLLPGRAVRYGGGWVALFREISSARFVALDANGMGLELYPMVGSRPAAYVQRVAFATAEEHLLAAPDANLLVRAVLLEEAEAPARIQVQALDGRDGSLRGEAFVAEPTDLAIGEVTVRIVPERALVLGFWHLPGLWLAAAGALLSVVGVIVRCIVRPCRQAVGIAHAPELGRWLVYVVVGPRDRRSPQFAALLAALRDLAPFP